MKRLAFLLAFVVLAACANETGAAASCDRIAGVRPGLCPIPLDERPIAPVDQLDSLSAHGLGSPLSLEHFRGRVVVVNFWASWCGPCRVEQPDLNQAHDLLPSEAVAFLGVNIEDSEANAAAHLREYGVTYPSVYDPANRFASRFEGVGPRTIPSTIFIDRHGRVAARIFGIVSTGELVGMADAIANEA